MRLFNWISLALAGTGLSYGVSRQRNSGRRAQAAQTRTTTYTRTYKTYKTYTSSNSGSAYAANSGSAYAANSGSAYAANSGSAYAANSASAYAANSGSAYAAANGASAYAAANGAYAYASMATGINGVFTECTLDNLQVICTCDTAVEPPEPTIPPTKPAPIIYIVAIVNDDGIGPLYSHIESFYTEMIALTANLEVKPEFRLVHRGNGEQLTDKNAGLRAPTPDYSCEDDAAHRYDVTQIASCIAEFGSFDECFHRKVPDSANVICVGNAYNAMYADLAGQSGRVALQYSVHPFSNQHQGRFKAEFVYKFNNSPLSYKDLLVQCNKADLFADSALIITDADYGNSGNQWKDSFSSTKRQAWSELNKCALSNAQDAPGKYSGLPAACSNYLNANQAESSLTNVDKRKECPMIPNFGSRTSTTLPRLIAKQFALTLQ